MLNQKPTNVDAGNLTPLDLAAQRREKQSAAAVSLVVVLALGAAKLAVGISTGSLGVVADAIHSALDFVAAVLTALVVRWADRPADKDHPYGHARGENVAAFVETLLLIGTAVWIGGEAIKRIVGGGGDVTPEPISFAVMVGSIAASYWRSRAMRAVARKHQSAALDAGALNFSMDVWSSLVVLAGLAIVSVARAAGLPPIFDKADAVAGLVVAGFVVYAAARLARETIDALVDRTPEDLVLRLGDAVARVPGVIECRRVRLRKAGGIAFADVVAIAPRAATLAETQAITREIVAAIHRIEPNADVMVDLRPGIPRAETIVDRVRLIARELGVNVHDVKILRVEGRLTVSLHVEVDPSLSLAEAHDLATNLEERIEASDPRVSQVNTHLETAPPNTARGVEVTRREGRTVRGIEGVAADVLGAGSCHDVRVYRSGRGKGGLDVVLHCSFPPSTPVTEAHLAAERFERALRERFPELAGVLVHVEPVEGGSASEPGRVDRPPAGT